MSKLPFVVEPRRKPIVENVGTEESGQIAIERRGYLSSGEKAFVQQALSSDSASLQIINLARKVSSQNKITLDEAYNLCVSILAGTAAGSKQAELAEKVEKELFEDFSELLKNLSSIQAKETLIKAFCLLQYRIDLDLSMSDVMDLHPDIISGLANLYDEEEARSTERMDMKEKAEEDGEVSIEKKPARRKTVNS